MPTLAISTTDRKICLMELPPRSKTANKQRQMKQIIKNQMAKYVRRGWINAVGRRAGKVKQDCRSGCMFFT